MLFFKYQSNSNDFLLFDARDREPFEAYFGLTVERLKAAKYDVPVEWSNRINRLCRRQLSVGADGVLVLFSHNNMACALVYNSDGSYGTFSGNGARIVGVHITNAMAGRCAFLMGEIPVAVDVEPNGMATVQVVQPSETPLPVPNSMGWSGFFVNVGNPHMIILKEISQAEFSDVASTLASENKSVLGDLNLSFAWRLKQDEYSMLVFERGVGQTQSCGSAALALFHLLRSFKQVGRSLTVVMPGGTMQLMINDDGSVGLSATVFKIFEGQLA